jgi:hypothetical protein
MGLNMVVSRERIKVYGRLSLGKSKSAGWLRAGRSKKRGPSWRGEKEEKEALTKSKKLVFACLHRRGHVVVRRKNEGEKSS